MSIVVSSRSTKGLGKGGRLRTMRKRTARGQQAKQRMQTLQHNYCAFKMVRNGHMARDAQDSGFVQLLLWPSVVCGQL